MPSIQHDMIAVVAQHNIRRQLWEGGYFYWGIRAAEGLSAVVPLNAGQVAKHVKPDKKREWSFESACVISG